MCSHLWATLRVDIGNDLNVVFGVESFEVTASCLYSAWHPIAKLRLKLTRRRVSSLITKLGVRSNMLSEMLAAGKLRSTPTDIVKFGRSSMAFSFIIHNFPPYVCWRSYQRCHNLPHSGRTDTHEHFLHRTRPHTCRRAWSYQSHG